MIVTSSLICALASLGYASPIVNVRQSNPFVYTNSNGLNFTQMNNTLPNVTIFATGNSTNIHQTTFTNLFPGGTIAGSGSSGVQTSGYTSGVVGILTLINAVPAILNISNVAGIQSANLGSEDVTSSLLITISNQINQYVCDDPTMAGAVVTHGTDVLEETAFFLDATVNCGKPVIIVGAMRPSTAISADGPYNLLEAVTVAASPLAKDRGAMVVMNDRIASAYYVTKTNANSLDTFKAPEMGYLGELVSNSPHFFYPPVTPTGKNFISLENVTSIPRVDILFAYEDMKNDTLYNAVASGAKGIVIAGAGAGGVSTDFGYAINDVIARYGIPVVQSTRAMSGEVPSLDLPNIASGYLNPMKSRILLGLLLAHEKNITEISAAFKGSTAD